MINGRWKTETRAIRRSGLSVLIFGGFSIWLAGTIGAGAEDTFERCRSVAADQARLDCFRGLLQEPPSASAPTVQNGAPEDLWPLVRTPRSNGAGDAVAVMRTAETTQSDPELAGLMIRCQDNSKLEVLLALVRPVPPRSERDVTIDSAPSKSVLRAEAIPTGTALVLPVDATTFTSGPWRELKQLSVSIHDPAGDIRGTISLEGIGPAMTRLRSSCPSR